MTEGIKIKKAELNITDETHFVACDESEPFVNRAAVVRRVKQETVDLLILRPGDDLFN